MASVLAVVAGSPAQAANTSAEVKIDHDNDAATATVREFAGQDRYDTALRLAKNFATSKGGLGSVPTAFVASGRTLVDSISVAGLAGYLDTPILLIDGDSLHGAVADFIEDYGVGTVHVLGGTAAISDDTLAEIEALSSKPTVERISGPDRYATAAAIAEKIDSDSSWCGTDAVSAVLINGATEMMSYGVAVQTIAYRLQLPVLMTAADELPDATVDFIRDNDVEHVQIIGGTGVVSADAESELTSLGVNTVERVSGDSASDVSVELAKLAGNGCGDSLGLVSGDMVALVRGNPDGVVAAPVLASSLAGGYLVPPLVVGDSLPASVSDYLAATPKAVGGNKLNLRIVAVGGTAAVSEATMSAALAAASSAGALSVSIAAGDDPSTADADEGDTNGDGMADADDPVRPGSHISLYFSDDIEAAGSSGDTANNALLAKLRDVIEVNGAPVSVTAVTTTAAGGSCLNRKATVTLGRALAEGDTVSVVESGHTFGTGSDKRTVTSASASVTVPAPDRTRPSVSVLGIAERSTPVTTFTVTFADAGGFAAGAGADIKPDSFTFVAASGKGNETTNVISSAPAPTVTAGAKSASVTVTIGRNLEVGDRLTVKPGQITDEAGNMSTGTSASAIKAQPSPRVNSILMSELKHSAHNSWTVPASNPFGAPVASGGTTVLHIDAKGSGDAAGAAGNAWSMLFDTASGYNASKATDIDVRVDTRAKRVTVRWADGPATTADLLAALRGNADFDSRFAARIADCTASLATPLVRTDAGRGAAGTATNAGRTQFAIEVNFNAYIASVVHDELLEDILAAAARRSKLTNDDSGIRGAPVGAGGAPAGGGLDLASPGAVTGPVQKVRYEGTAAVLDRLPAARDLVTILAGAEEVGDADADLAGEQARGNVDEVAVGYAIDDPNEAADESRNGYSQRRISVSSSVKARNN